MTKIIENVFNSLKETRGSATPAAIKKCDGTIENRGYAYFLAVSNRKY